jgi:Fe(II)/alpha-ketoglutarate-dependent arginine beta-hydroxylase
MQPAFSATPGRKRIKPVMDEYSMSTEDLEIVKSLLADIATQYSSAESACLLKDARLWGDRLPWKLRSFLNDFKLMEPAAGACLVSGFPIDDAKIGTTPGHWKNKSKISAALEAELLMVLLSSLLGDVFGWAAEQDGNIIHEVVPIKEHEDSQISSSSKQLIWWHTEDAFHRYRGDYLCLMCLRNPDKVATTFAGLTSVDLDYERTNLLFEPRFVFFPDEAHNHKNDGSNGRPLDSTQTSGLEIDGVQKMAVLEGIPSSPYLRIDPYYMQPLEEADEASSALHLLIQAIDENVSEIVLRPGDFLFIDNFRAVHGRRPFTAKYDGTDRWLKRINITRDLRKSRSARSTSTSRVIF